jgi:ankyrin repeat protein
MLSPAPQIGWAPLHNASGQGHLAVVEALLAKGADVEAKNVVSIARAGALCPSRSLAHLQNAHATSGDVPVCTPLLLSRRHGSKA